MATRIKALAAPYRWGRRRLTRWLFERHAPVDTSIAWWGDRPETDDWHRYEPSGWFFLRRALRRLDVSEDDVFVDFGSGLGRVLYVASKYPFSRIVGVEVHEELNRRAGAYLDSRLGPESRARVELVTVSAEVYAIPPDMTFAYLANPFAGELFKSVLDNIIRSLNDHPRQLTILYANPVMAEAIEETGRFHLVHLSRGLRRDRPERRIAIYRTRSERNQRA